MSKSSWIYTSSFNMKNSGSELLRLKIWSAKYQKNKYDFNDQLLVNFKVVDWFTMDSIR